MQNQLPLRREICEIGRRVYARGFAAANDGNISVRIGPNEVLCSPTMICKGFMQPDDLCTVDLDGKQLSGRRKRTSEILLHLAIYKERPEIKSVVHCHPPHATAFAVAREPIPQCVLPEVEVFLGDVPIARYETPGTQIFAETVLPHVKKASVMILANHGTVSYGESVEQAYWWTEILDAYCRILLLARQLGGVKHFTEGETRELLALKQRLGFPDPRLSEEYRNCDVCANDVFRPSWAAAGVERRAFDAPPPMRSAGAAAEGGIPIQRGDASRTAAAVADQEALVQAVTDQVLAALSRQGVR